MDIITAVAALLPSVVLMVYIYSKDRVDKEPPKLLAALFFCGVLSTIPAIILETIYEKVNVFFFNFIGFANTADQLENNILYLLSSNFIGVALVEELCKWIFMFLLTRKSKEFNSLFDGIVYAVFVSLGFATLENVFYVLEGGISVAAMRAVLSVPGHMFDAVFMGYYYSWWHIYKKASYYEDYYFSLGLVRYKSPEFDKKAKSYLVLSLAVPVIVHGMFDYCLSRSTTLSIVAFFILMGVLYIICFSRIKNMSKNDTKDDNTVMLIIFKKHTDLYLKLSELATRQSYGEDFRAIVYDLANRR